MIGSDYRSITTSVELLDSSLNSKVSRKYVLNTLCNDEKSITTSVELLESSLNLRVSCKYKY